MFFSWLRWIFSINCNAPAILWSLLASGLHSLVWDGASAYRVFWEIQQICLLLSAFSFWLLGKVHCQCGAKLHETQRLWSMVKHSMFDKKTKKAKKTSLRPSLLALPSGLGDLASGGGWTDRGWHWTGLSWMDPFWTHGHLYGCQHPRARVAGWSIRRTMLLAHDTINVSKSSSGIQWISIQLPTNLSAFIEMVTGLVWPASDYVSFVSPLS